MYEREAHGQMSDTSELLRLFRVEKQLRGLRSRLTGAERFLKAQKAQLDAVERYGRHSPRHWAPWVL